MSIFAIPKTYMSMITESDSPLSIDELNAALMSENPGQQLELLRRNGRLITLIPELEPTFDMEQNAYHFGTVWEHTMKAMELISTETDSLLLRMTMLLHDIGKPQTRTCDDNGKVHFKKHEVVGSELSRVVLQRLGYPDDFVEEVAFYILFHMTAKQWGNHCEKMKDKSLRRLQYQCGTRSRFDALLIVVHADNMAHAAEWCMPDQTRCLAQRTDEMVAEGNSRFVY